MPRQTQNGGEIVAFPRHVGNGLIDLRAIRAEIEEAEEISETKGVDPFTRRKWITYRDLMEQALDVRIDLIQRDTHSHERAISGQVTPMCRQGERHDPSVRELRTMACGRCQSTEGPEAA